MNVDPADMPPNPHEQTYVDKNAEPRVWPLFPVTVQDIWET